jgi:hypothetical protein
MQLGIHLIERGALAALATKGVEVPEPWIGVIDLARTIEGLLPEPVSRRPLGVVGLDRLLEAAGDEAPAVMSLLRRSFHDGRSYFEWSRIPLVVLVAGRLGPHHDGGPELTLGAKRWPLAPIVGKRLEPVAGDDRWWWAPQIV